MNGSPKKETLEKLLGDFVERVAGARAVAVSSTDGLSVHTYGIESPDDADHVSAVSASMFSLARGTNRLLGSTSDKARQIVAEAEGGLFFVTHPAAGALLTVLASHEADLGLIGYEMKMLGQSIGAHLANAPRTAVTG